MGMFITFRCQVFWTHRMPKNIKICLFFMELFKKLKWGFLRSVCGSYSIRISSFMASGWTLKQNVSLISSVEICTKTVLCWWENIKAVYSVILFLLWGHPWRTYAQRGTEGKTQCGQREGVDFYCIFANVIHGWPLSQIVCLDLSM